MLNNSTRIGGWLLLLPLLILLAGCYDEHDVITITNGGLMHFESTVTVSDGDKKMSLETLQETANQVVSQLQQASWTVKLAWISEKRPYKLTFSGEGKLAEVGRVTSFYRLYKLDDHEYTISFIMPNSEDGSTRSIAFKSPPGQAEVLDRKGQPVVTIDSASANDLYAIKLH